LIQSGHNTEVIEGCMRLLRPEVLMATSRILGLLVVAALTGAVSAASQQVSSPANRNRRVITTEEIEQARETNAFQVVEKVRPEFLVNMTRRHTLDRGAMQQPDLGYSQPDPEPTAAVFVDGTEMGGLDELRQIQSNTVDEIRYLSGSEAQTKYGPRFPAGVIEVRLKNY
jgi:hypothetical protein